MIDGNVLVSLTVCQIPPSVVSSREAALVLYCFCYMLIVLLVYVMYNDVICHLFADDVKLYTVIKTLTDCQALQVGSRQNIRLICISFLYPYDNVPVLY